MTFFPRASRTVAGISVLAVLFVVGGAATAALAVSTAWSPPANVSATGNNKNLHIAVDGAGLATAVWDNFDGTHLSVQASSSLNGAQWSSPVTVSTTENNDTPQIGVDGSGRATAVWEHNDGINLIVQASYSVNGAAWSAPVTVSSPGYNTYAQLTVDGSGLATAVWISLGTATNNTVQASYSVNGATWSAPATLATILGGISHPQITVDGSGRVTALWNDAGLKASSSLNGATWSAPVAVSAGESASDAQITVDGLGRATAVWTVDGGQGRVLRASSSLPGAAWSTPTNLSVDGQNAGQPQVTVDGSGRVTAVWSGYNGTIGILEASTSLDGVAWSIPAELSAAGQDASSPQITVDGSGLATAIWLGSDDGDIYGVHASTSLNGAPWSAPVTISTPGQDENQPQIAADKSGFAAAAWLLTDGDNFIV